MAQKTKVDEMVDAFERSTRNIIRRHIGKGGKDKLIDWLRGPLGPNGAAALEISKERELEKI